MVSKDLTNPVPVQLRPQRKLLRMVGELHTRGYQRLRAVPYIGGAGFWRCLIVPVSRISARHGARLVTWDGWQDYAPYSDGGGREYWGWKDRRHCTPSELTEVFLKRWEQLAAEGYGQDWLYAGWYQHVLHVTYPDDLPIAWTEESEPEDHMTTVRRGLRIPLPPPGELADPMAPLS